MVPQKRLRIVIDTNVLVSALLFGGIPGELFDLCRDGAVKAFASKEIIDEYVRVLAYPRFQLTEEEIQYLLYEEILPHFEVTDPKKSQKVIVKQDPADDKFIHCAQSAAARLIVSGDRHLLSLKSVGSINILSPAEFLRTFRSPDSLPS